MNPRVAVVILNYNTRELLTQFIPFVLATEYDNYELVVVDNASDDHSADFVRSGYPEIKLISFEENHGYAGGYNKALEHIHADYFVLLNSDVEVKPDWLKPMVHLLERDHSIAACQPKIISYSDRNLFEYAGAAGGYIDKFGYPFCKGRIFDSLEHDQGQYDQASEVFWASGACLFIRASAWKGSGGLDTDFFAHMEEIDLCWRLRSMGHKLFCCPQSVVFHIGGGTLSQQSSRKTYLNFRNGLALLAKNLPVRQLFYVILVRLLLDHIAAYRFLAIGKGSDFRAIAKAHFHFLKRLRFWLRKRGDVSSRPLTGIYPKSIVVQYFLKKKKEFRDLKWSGV